MSTTRRTREASRQDAVARAEQAAEFLETATEAHALHPERTDVVVPNAVLAGIAAGNAICAVRLGESALGEGRAEAVPLLRRAAAPDGQPAADLGRLIGLRTNATYSPAVLASARVDEVLRWATRSVEAAQAVLAGP